MASSEADTAPPTTTSTPHELCDNCFKGSLIPGEPRGKMEELAGIQYYVTDPDGQTPKEGKAIVYLADIFGLWNNAKILSDKIADGTGCRVFAPDMLEGDAVKPDNFYMITQPIGNRPFLTRMTEMAKTFGSVFTGIGVGWILKHTQERVGGVVQKFVSALKEEKKYTRIGATGYCLGGIYVIKLGSTDLVDVIVASHPGPLKVSDFESMKSQPVSFVFAEEDLLFSDKVRDGGVETLKKKGNDVQMEIYKGTTHGFAARPDLSVPEVKKAFQEALAQTVNWFNKHL